MCVALRSSAHSFRRAFTIRYMHFVLRLWSHTRAVWDTQWTLGGDDCFVGDSSGALADTIGRRKLLIFGAVCMLLEMGVLLVAPIGGGTWLFVLFAFNRLLSGAAEAAVSGADEALAYDSLKAAGLEGEWAKVLERVQRVTSLAFFFTMLIGAAVYDSDMMNTILQFHGKSSIVEQTQLIKLPILLTFFSGIVVFWMALRMKESPAEEGRTIRETLTNSWRLTGAAALGYGRRLCPSPLS